MIIIVVILVIIITIMIIVIITEFLLYAAGPGFKGQDLCILLCSFGADSSSPQISAILVGHFT